MLKSFFHNHRLIFLIGILLCVLGVHNYFGSSVWAVTNPQSGSVGVEGTLGGAPPTQGATIVTPTNGQVFTANPITVNGLCPKGLLVKIFDNNVFVGSVQCTNGSYSIQIDLFSGRNDLVARVYDALDQAGPDSNTVTVTFNNAQFSAFGSQMTLTSSYAKRGANPGTNLDWPIVLSGGTGPYAISVDWGDGKTADLFSQSFPGTITINHVYSLAGIYTITIRVTDKNGQIAFLQLVGVANGPIAQSGVAGTQNNPIVVTKILWWPAAVLLPLIGIAFWLGRRHQLLSLRRNLERSNERQAEWKSAH